VLMRALLRAERTVAGPLNRAANSRQAAGGLMLIARGNRLALGAADRTRATVVHLMHLPTHRDVQLLDAKVERLQRALDDLAAEQRDREAAS
jgi:hypothetical protein